MESQIFISYRRTGGDVTAKLICETLKNKGYTVFYDFDNLKGGYFDDGILRAIEGCRDFVLVLPPHALDRCVNDDDWVRNEIRHALSRGNDINIIPVMLPGFEFPKDLPADIAAVSRINGVSFNMNYFDAVIGSIIERLKSQPYGQAAPAPQPQPQPTAADDRMQQLVQLASTPEGRALLDSLLKNNATPAAPQPQQQPAPEQQPQSAPEPPPVVIPTPPVLSQSSEGLDLQLNEAGTEYAVIGIGDCEDTDIVIPKEFNGIPVTSIAEKAFDDCYMTSVYIPEGVKRIECQAFSRCDTLQDVYVPNSIEFIGAWSFKGCKSLLSFTIPANTTSVISSAFNNCLSLKAFYVNPNNQVYCNHGPHLFSKDLTTLVRYAPGCKNEEYAMPDSVTRLKESSFDSCEHLKSIIISPKLTFICDSAFCNCSQLTDISLHNNDISWIGLDCFRGCISLKNATLPKQLTNITYGVFTKCSSLKSIHVPYHAKSIGTFAFYDCTSLESVTISPRVSKIDYCAFGYCESLTSIQYKGTKEMWNKIELNSSWCNGTPLKVIHCTDGDILL